MHERLTSAQVVVEVPRGSRIKRAANGSIDFVSPMASPFNYGSVIDTSSADGEPLDALVLGPPLPLGHRQIWPVHGVVRFVDEGLPDPKLVCGPHPPTAQDEARILAFFRRYAMVKAAFSRLRRRGPVRFLGLERW